MSQELKDILEALAYLVGILATLAGGGHFLIQWLKARREQIRKDLNRSWSNEGLHNPTPAYWHDLDLAEHSGELAGGLTSNKHHKPLNAIVRFGILRTRVDLIETVGMKGYTVAVLDIRLSKNRHQLSWRLLTPEAASYILPEATLLASEERIDVWGLGTPTASKPEIKVATTPPTSARSHPAPPPLAPPIQDGLSPEDIGILRKVLAGKQFQERGDIEAFQRVAHRVMALVGSGLLSITNRQIIRNSRTAEGGYTALAPKLTPTGHKALADADSQQAGKGELSPEQLMALTDDELM